MKAALQAELKTNQFWLLLSLGVYLPLLIFVGLAIGVWYHGKGFLWDVPILQAVHAASQPEWEPFVRVLSKLGVSWGVFPASVTIALILAYQQRWRALTYWLLTLLSSPIINHAAKLFIHRERPTLWELLVPKLDYAFPSGHAMSSMTFVAVLVILTWDTRWRWWTLLASGSFALAIGWTRLYLGVHFPSDIVGGWSLSIAWAIGMSLLVQPQKTPDPTPDRPQITAAD